MKKFIFIVTIFCIWGNSLVYAASNPFSNNSQIESSYQWEMVSTDSSGADVYIAPKSVVNVNNLTRFNEPYFQVLVKINTDVMACAFRLHNGVKYFYALPIDIYVNELLNMPSVDAQQKEVYEQARRAGISPSEAQAVAESYRNEFREKNINRLVEGIRTLGLDPDGSLNPIGVYLLFKLVNESPHYTAQLLQTWSFSTNFEVVPDISVASMIYDGAFRYALLPRK